MEKTMHFALGFQMETAPRWREIMAPPAKPANYTDATFQAKLPELWEKKEATAREYPLSGVVQTLVVAPIGIEVVAHAVPPSPKALLADLRKYTDGDIRDCVLWGVDTRQQLRILALANPDDAACPYFLLDAKETPLRLDVFSIGGCRTVNPDVVAWANYIGKGAAAGMSTAIAEAMSVMNIVEAYGLRTMTLSRSMLDTFHA